MQAGLIKSRLFTHTPGDNDSGLIKLTFAMVLPLKFCLVFFFRNVGTIMVASLQLVIAGEQLKHQDKTNKGSSCHLACLVSFSPTWRFCNSVANGQLQRALLANGVFPLYQLSSLRYDPPFYKLYVSINIVQKKYWKHCVADD